MHGTSVSNSSLLIAPSIPPGEEFLMQPSVFQAPLLLPSPFTASIPTLSKADHCNIKKDLSARIQELLKYTPPFGAYGSLPEAFKKQHLEKVDAFRNYLKTFIPLDLASLEKILALCETHKVCLIAHRTLLHLIEQSTVNDASTCKTFQDRLCASSSKFLSLLLDIIDRMVEQNAFHRQTLGQSLSYQGFQYSILLQFLSYEDPALQKEHFIALENKLTQTRKILLEHKQDHALNESSSKVILNTIQLPLLDICFSSIILDEEIQENLKHQLIHLNTIQNTDLPLIRFLPTKSANNVYSSSE